MIDPAVKLLKQRGTGMQLHCLTSVNLLIDPAVNLLAAARSLAAFIARNAHGHPINLFVKGVCDGDAAWLRSGASCMWRCLSACVWVWQGRARGGMRAKTRR